MKQKEKHKWYIKFLSKWGFRLQMVVAMEEMAELTKVLCKKLRKGPACHILYLKNQYSDCTPYPNDESIVEELADVSFMLDQLISIWGVQGQVNKIKMEKLLRTIDRFEKDNATYASGVI